MSNNRKSCTKMSSENDHTIGRCVPQINPTSENTRLKSVTNNLIKSKSECRKGCKPIGINKSEAHLPKHNKTNETSNCSAENLPDLSTPGVCTVLKLASEIEASTGQLSQRTRLKDIQCLNKIKVPEKTNVPFTKQIFQNLVDLNVIDSTVDITSHKIKSKQNNFVLKKDIPFDLSSFYTPDFSTQFKPNIKQIPQEVDCVEYYNGFEIYDLVKHFNCD